ncbi:hypothetical protein Trydic_g23258 [Trypoxylus dichotomus]
MEGVAIPLPPALPPPLKAGSFRSRRNSSSSGFRLQDHPQPQQDDASSVYSLYKQKIDSMFESDTSSKVQNCVQARIEKMFSDVAKDGGIPINDIGCHSFSVDYMGSVPLQEKVTSLAGLQSPLSELYFSYRKSSRHKKLLTGRLEISSSGLKVQYQGEKGDLEQLNSFPTIAVWSAVKFVMQGNQQPASYAFLPLITDPDNLEKQQLFRSVDPSEKKLTNFFPSEVHSPLFAVVMRKIGAHKQLECHGFICQTSEDAIVIAATLYKALMAHMKAKERKPKNKNGVTCMSVGSSIYNDPGGAPVRPPRRKRSSNSSVKSGGGTTETVDTAETKRADSMPQNVQKIQNSKQKKNVESSESTAVDLDAIVPYEEPKQIRQEPEEITEIKPQPLLDKFNTYRSTHQKQITAEIKQVMNESVNMGLKRVKSVRKRIEETKENSGDILTKVTIPRSGSFLNAGGLTRYKSKVQRNNGLATGGSPLGFSELFNEFRLQEGLHSVDEILGVIIDPEGMSFNDLKPIYKEFLLKLALTLTKDELYQRSKLIMRRQKKKLTRNNSVHSKKRQVPVYNRFKRLKHIFQKIRLAKETKLTTGSSENDAKLPESSISSSSYDTRHFKPKEVKITRRQSYKKRSSNKNRRDRVSTSEESDFFSLRRKKPLHPNSTQNRNSSSGYVSCSECSYDSDTCTCTSADKCYCSLGNKNCKYSPDSSNKKLKCCCAAEKSEFIWCGCDTDSCTDSNKCYCSMKKEKNTIFEQLKQRGFIPSSETVTTPPNHRKLCKRNSNTRSTKSLEYMSNPSEKYYEKLKRTSSSSKQKKKRSYTSDNLAVDYELFSIANGKICNITNRNIYDRHVGEVERRRSTSRSSVKSLNSYKFDQSRNSLEAQAIPVKACTEALSVKKSAEIAALFADIKLSQTTDIAHLIPKQIDPEVLVSYKNAYNRRPASRCGSRIERIETPADSKHFGRMINNTLYASKSSKSNMYSARNGLYTIQSQSDDSRSSLERSSNRKKGEYRPQKEEKKSVSSALENSLGYLP